MAAPEEKVNYFKKAKLQYNTKVTNFYYAFSDCTSLTTIPIGLFDNNTEVTNFQYTFYNCTSLETMPTNLIANNELVDNYSNMFSGCTSLTTAVTGTEKFIGIAEANANDHTITLTTTDCFYNCTSITDYNSIPSAWGGPA